MDEIRGSRTFQDRERQGSFLTPRQVQVLRLRSRGCSQQEVADIMGTTRSNVSILERRAHQNIAKARNTIRQYSAIQAPVSVRINAGTDLFEVPRMVFAEADRLGIHLPVNFVEVVVGLREGAPDSLDGRVVAKTVDVFVTDGGDLLVQDPLDLRDKGSATGTKGNGGTEENGGNGK